MHKINNKFVLFLRIDFMAKWFLFFFSFSNVIGCFSLIGSEKFDNNHFPLTFIKSEINKEPTLQNYCREISASIKFPLLGRPDPSSLNLAKEPLNIIHYFPIVAFIFSDSPEKLLTIYGSSLTENSLSSLFIALSNYVNLSLPLPYEKKIFEEKILEPLGKKIVSRELFPSETRPNNSQAQVKEIFKKLSYGLEKFLTLYPEKNAFLNTASKEEFLSVMKKFIENENNFYKNVEYKTSEKTYHSLQGSTPGNTVKETSIIMISKKSMLPMEQLFAK